MNDPDSNAVSVTDVTPELLKQWLDSGEAILVDVREDYEHASEHIDGANLHPLSKFDAEQVRSAYPDKRVVFHCRSGKRSHDAATRFGNSGEQVFHLAGGIEAWKNAGHEVVRSASAPAIPVMRQVQITAGALVAIGTLLGVVESSWFLIVPAFVGCGLVFAGLTGWCGMAAVLGAMPWNRVKGSGTSASCCSA